MKAIAAMATARRAEVVHALTHRHTILHRKGVGWVMVCATRFRDRLSGVWFQPETSDGYSETTWHEVAPEAVMDLMQSMDPAEITEYLRRSR